MDDIERKLRAKISGAYKVVLDGAIEDCNQVIIAVTHGKRTKSAFNYLDKHLIERYWQTRYEHWHVPTEAVALALHLSGHKIKFDKNGRWMVNISKRHIEVLMQLSHGVIYWNVGVMQFDSCKWDELRKRGLT